MTPQNLEQLAARLLQGQISLEEFVGHASRPGIADVGEAQVDLDRHRRCGFPEVVFAQGKTVAAMEKIFAAQIAHGVDVLATRMSAEQAAELLAKFPAARYNPVGRTFRIPLADPQPHRDGEAQAGRVTIVTAGTSDLPVAEEARETALWTGAEVTRDPGRGRGRPAPADRQPPAAARGRRRSGGGGHGRAPCPAWWAATSPAP